MTKVVSVGYSLEEQEVSMNYNQGQWVIYRESPKKLTLL